LQKSNQQFTTFSTSRYDFFLELYDLVFTVASINSSA
jgi:hypothetical protein